MNEIEKLKEKTKEIEKKLGYSFKNKKLLYLSFVHRSFVNENKKIISEHNERLEFLGDNVLNLIVSEYLYKKVTKASEGKMSHIRSSLVNAASCGRFLKKLKLQTYILLSKGEKKTEKRGRKSILSDAFEAVVGAIYLDGGFLKVKKFIIENFEKDFLKEIKNPEIDFKGKLQKYSQRKFKKTPEYIVIKEEGPQHFKTFHIDLVINDKIIAKGKGSSKKLAELDAAKKACRKMKL